MLGDYSTVSHCLFGCLFVCLFLCFLLSSISIFVHHITTVYRMNHDNILSHANQCTTKIILTK